MIIEKKKYFFKTVQIILDDNYTDNLTKNSFLSYSNIIILSYKKLDLPNFYLRQKTTALIDLLKPEEETFKKFSDTTRNEIRKTIKNDGLIVTTENINYGLFYKLYSDFEYGQGRVPVSLNDFKLGKLFGAFYKGELVSAILVFKSFPYLRIRSIFSKRLFYEDREIYKIISNASRRLVWEICLWGKREGFNSLDLASVNFKNPNTENITKFKMSFGGEVINEYTYIYKSRSFFLFEKLVFIKLVILRILNKIFKKIWKN